MEEYNINPEEKPGKFGLAYKNQRSFVGAISEKMFGKNAAPGIKRPSPFTPDSVIDPDSRKKVVSGLTTTVSGNKSDTPLAPAGQTPFIANRKMSGTERFDKTKLTLGNTPSGKVGFFKNGEMLDTSKTRLSGGNLGGTPLPAGQQTSFVKNPVAQAMVQNLTTPQPQTGIPGVTTEPGAIPGAMPGGNWTGLMNAETAMLNAAVNPKLKPGQFQDFRSTIGMKPGTPGGDGAFRSIESQIADLTNQNKQLLGGYGQTTDMGNLSQGQRMAMVQKNSETIKGLNDSLTGRSTLANDLVKALIGAQSNQQVANTAAGADVEKADITGKAGIEAARIEAQGRSADAAYKTERTAQYQENNFNLNRLKALQQNLQKQLDASPGDNTIKGKLDQINSAIELLGSNSDDFLQKMIAAAETN